LPCMLKNKQQYLFTENILKAKPTPVSTWAKRFKRLVAGTEFASHTIHGMRGGRAQKEKNTSSAAIVLQVTPVIA